MLSILLTFVLSAQVDVYTPEAQKQSPPVVAKLVDNTPPSSSFAIDTSALEQLAQYEYETPKQSVVATVYSMYGCAPCAMLEQAVNELRGVGWDDDMVSINKLENETSGQHATIRSYPTTIITVDGKEVERFTGAMSASQLAERINVHRRAREPVFNARRTSAIRVGTIDGGKDFAQKLITNANNLLGTSGSVTHTVSLVKDAEIKTGSVAIVIPKNLEAKLTSSGDKLRITFTRGPYLRVNLLLQPTITAVVVSGDTITLELARFPDVSLKLK